MKNIKLKYLITVALVILVVLPASSQGKKEQKDEGYREMISLVENGNYVLTVRSVNPTGARTVHPTGIYTFEARDSVFSASLPYFGRAYQASYGGDGPIEFDATAENLKISQNDRKRQVRVSFRIKGTSDSYDITLEVGYTGYASLYITPVKRQAISYYGTVEAVE